MIIYRLRRLWYAISIILFVGSLVVFATFKLPLGTDFTGGNLAEVAVPSSSTESIKSTLTGQGIEATVQPTASQTYIIRYSAKDPKAQLASAEQLQKMLPNSQIVQFTSVGPTMGKTLQQKALEAIALASVGIIIYLAWSFRRVGNVTSAWAFGFFAVVALIHDVIVTTGFISLVGHFATQVSIDSYFITAILTVLAYSVNDTIVVYDRIREVLWKDPSLPLPVVIERSIQQTASRSLNTSLAIVLAVTPMLVLSGATLLTFLLTMSFGIVVGTYSSIFLAAPLLGSWQAWRRRPRRVR